MAPPEAEAPTARPRGSFRRFLLSGAVNTALTYLVYLVLLAVLGHRLSYSVSFGAGIALAYSLNRIYVFREHSGWRSALATPAIYALQYLLGLSMVEIWVRWLRWPAEAAPLAAVVVTVPLTYFLSRKAFARV